MSHAVCVCERSSRLSPWSSTTGFPSASACRISIWQYGRCNTPGDKKSTKAAASSMPLSMPSLVRSSARLSYHALKPRIVSSR